MVTIRDCLFGCIPLGNQLDKQDDREPMGRYPAIRGVNGCRTALKASGADIAELDEDVRINSLESRWARGRGGFRLDTRSWRHPNRGVSTHEGATTVNDIGEMPELNFFRATPAGLLDNPPLASSLQTFETALFLIALGRYPSALVSCGSAWESAIKAKWAIPPDDRITAAKLIEMGRGYSVPLRAFDGESLRAFREKRNSVVHYGFSPKDDEQSARLLLESGLPFLSLLYQELFDFFLDWKALRPSANAFGELNREEMLKVGLLPYIADHLRDTSIVYSSARGRGAQDYRYCFRGLERHLAFSMKQAAMSESEWAVLEAGNTGMAVFEAELEAKKGLKKVLHEPTWEFNCPVCEGGESLVAELDETQLESLKVVPSRCVCIRCGCFARDNEPSACSHRTWQGTCEERPNDLQRIWT